ncbi:GYDIA family GHMP kinase [Sediminicola luteus]|uniref:GHMP kinase n=1 Tax=Sediminicola luteus TaxID=319238 RepID=A0A2A4GD29_9FLAO|nr:GYDIA family GHMP kinase [Sediminicola luteus]PCE65880.1 hypothetical protein B7P33_00845 [Sediminicola luteus]
MERYYAHGKLLLTAEYAVLEGAKALALPTKLGQCMEVSSIDGNTLLWQAYDHQDTLWYQGRFKRDGTHLAIDQAQDLDTSTTLLQLLNHCIDQRHEFLEVVLGKEVATHLEFPRDWGLGSSSTLISTLAQWSQTDPYKLLWEAFGGSGYDLACSQAQGPIFYTKKWPTPIVTSAPFNPDFTNELFFVHLNQKQNSREAITQYRKKGITSDQLASVNELTDDLTQATSLDSFEKALASHEDLLAEVLGIPPVKERLFPDYPGQIKSLGAWGGDFVLATRQEATSYFPGKGYTTVIPYPEMIL